MNANRPKPKGHHQITRFYLERFAGDDPEGHVWSYDMETGKAWNATSDNTAKETHLYSLTLENGQKITDLEEFIAGIESKAVTPFDKLLLGEKIIGQERADLASFFAMMFVRTNAFRRFYAEAYAGFMNVQLYATGIHDGAFRSSMEKYEAEHGPLSDEEREAVRDGLLNPGKFKISIDREWTLQALTFHDHLVPILFEMHWSVMVAPEGRYFITSDNPFVRTMPERHQGLMRGGFLDKHIEVTFPLSPERCLLAHWKKEQPNLGSLPREGVKAVNRLRAVYAERFLYGPHRDAGITALARKYRDVKPGMKISGFAPENFSPVTLRRH